MKIYPGDHSVVTSEEVTVNHIPLGYFTEAVKNLNPFIKINPDYCRQSVSKTVYPYQSFNTDNIMLFDNNDKPVNNQIYLKRNGNAYYFEPINSIEFIPTEFRYNVLIAREDTFKSNIQYKLKIAAYDSDIAEKLIGMVNSESQIKPKNITVNDGSLIPESLINMSLSEADFLFINKNNISNIDSYLNNHVNLWILSDNFEGIMTKDENIESYELNNSQIYSNSIYTLDGYTKVKFDINQELSDYPKTDYQYINLFNNAIPVLLLKKENGGFVIFSHSSILDHTDTCYQLIYEIIAAVYLNSYFETETRTSYITDDKIDYYLTMNKKYGEYHPRINLPEILFSDGFNTGINYNTVSIILDNNDIIYVGQNHYGDILLKKNNRSDPEKTGNMISFYTSNNTVVIFDSSNNIIKTIEDNLEIKNTIINENNYISINTFRSTNNSINNGAQLISIPDSIEYNLCYDYDLNSFYLIPSSQYNENNYGINYATIQFTYDEEISCGDIRTVGGGEESSTPNYDMIDTGSIKGRPYRLGSTMIIKLPERFKNQKDIITTELNKHISSADYFILIFE